MKSEKARTKAMALAICMVFLVAVSGVLGAASTQNVSEDVSGEESLLDYVSSVDVQEESLLDYVSSVDAQEESLLDYVSSVDVREESLLNYVTSEEAQEESLLDYVASEDVEKESLLDYIASEEAKEESLLDYISSEEAQNESLLDHIAFEDTKTADCEIKYDDGTWETRFSWKASGWGLAVHFTNTCPGTKLKTAKFYIAKDPEEFDWKVLEWTGSEPGDVIKSGTTKPTRTGWHKVDVGVTVPKDFVIASYQTAANKPYLGADKNSPIDDRSWYYAREEWGKFNDLVSPKEYDLMIRAEMTDTGPKLCTTPDPPSHDFSNVPVNETRTWTFNIKNCDSGTLTWSVSDDQPWITVTPTSGIETSTVTVTIDTHGLTSCRTYTGDITVSSNGGTKTGTISVHPIDETEVSISVKMDKFKYCPGDTMLISVDITNPTGSEVIFEKYGGVPQFKLWMPVDKKTVSGDKTIEEEMSVGKWSSEPFDMILYVRLLDPATGQVLAADSTCCVYCPTCG